MNYKETFETSKEAKEKYLSGIYSLIEKRKEESFKKRDEYCKGIFKTPEKYRQELKNILGWPLTEDISTQIPKFISENLFEKDGLNIYRMSFEILDGVNLCGILIKKDDKKRPLVLAQHGALGSAEVVSGFYDTTGNYNDFVQRLLNCDVNIFAPQLLIWDAKQFDLDYDRAVIDAKLKRVGSSVAAIELFGLVRILDYFEAQSYVTSFGMAGLSYGGYYTMLLSAIDTRIKSAISCSFFCSGNCLLDRCDMYYFDLGNKMSWAEIAALTYPRQLCLAMGDTDLLFPYKESEKEFKRLESLCKTVGTDWVDFIVFEGEHEFIKDDAPIKKLANDLWTTE